MRNCDLLIDRSNLFQLLLPVCFITGGRGRFDVCHQQTCSISLGQTKSMEISLVRVTGEVGGVKNLLNLDHDSPSRGGRLAIKPLPTCYQHRDPIPRTSSRVMEREKSSRLRTVTSLVQHKVYKVSTCREC